MNDPTPFDPAGPLPHGAVVLEASAGTGKTWTIAALATRYVAEAGIPIEEILVVTFTRAATSELRERVRDRLAEAARFLATGSGPEDTNDPVLAHLAAADSATRAVFVEQLQAALTGFDRATIATLHGFAARLLTSLGLLAGVPSGLTVEADHGELRSEAITDLLVARFADTTDEPVTLRSMNDIATAVLTNPDAAIVPDPAEVDGDAAVRAQLAPQVRPTLATRGEAAGIMTYDDLLVRVRDALADPKVGEAAARLAAEQYQVALIDEFQDTDRIQWEIARRLFSGSDATLVVIGDPKQAIFAFRGADVDAYLDAVDGAGTEHTLITNWRSDAALIQGLDAVFGGVAFGDDRIRYRTVGAAPHHAGSAITGVAAPVTLRYVGRDAPVGREYQKRKTFLAGDIRPFVAADAATSVVELLTTARIHGEAVQPEDIAVLCRTQAQVELVKTALTARDVPAVVGRTGSVLTSPAASHWLTLLTALEAPASPPRVRRAALTPFLGKTPTWLLTASDDDLLQLHDRITAWAQLLARRGVPALMAAIERSEQMTARVLARPDGERTATDLTHLAELLHRAHRAGGTRSLVSWLSAEKKEAEEQAEAPETRARRLETDAAAVHVLTIHAAKGLEFPIVLAPYLWDAWSREPAVPVFHPPGTDGRVVDVAGEDNWDQFDAHCRLAMEEDAGEELRLAYVALTRAKHHLAVWWARYSGAKAAPLTRILFGRTPDGLRDTVSMLSDDTRMLAKLELALDVADGALAVTEVTETPATDGWAGPPAALPVLEAAGFVRDIDRAWRRTSFSGLTAAAHAAMPLEEPDRAVKDDEPAEDNEEALVADARLPYAAMPAGVRFGTLVHEILEDVDLAAPDPSVALAEVVGEHVARSGLDLEPADLVAALTLTLHTPLGPDGAPVLADLPATDRVAEMGFELPVATATGSVTTGNLADLLAQHLPPEHPLAAYPARLREMPETRFRGFLTGSIDLVARIGPEPTYWIADYKTNRLDWPDPDLSAYGPDGMAAAMIHGDYVLQALLYQTALHRYLRLRLPGYDPTRHLGGAMYLFVRGMIGTDTPLIDGTRCGVFTWPASVELIEAVSDLFDTGTPS